ncbi:hypothetical protein GCM10010270_06120 [Streptomyces violaceus]|nr:hypothetical protein GCM10010270_06120 [Streptomyces janthinus]
MIRKLTHLWGRHLLTLVQMQPRSTDANPVHRTAVEVTDAAGPQVCGAMRSRRLGALRVVDEQGSAPGILALSR